LTFNKIIQQKPKNNWTFQEWWIIYAKGIQLVKLLLERHSHLFIKDALFFVGIHEEYLTDCLMLAKTSLEPNAMKLIKMTLELMSEIITYETTWRVDYFQSIMSLMVSCAITFHPKPLSYGFFSAEMHAELVGYFSVTSPSSEDSQTVNGSVKDSTRRIFRHDFNGSQR
jgi:hypothetical protein